MLIATLIADSFMLVLLIVTAWSWRRLSGRIAEFQVLRAEVAAADRESHLRLEAARTELSRLVSAAQELAPGLTEAVKVGNPLLTELRFVSKMAEGTADRLVEEHEEASKAGNRLARLAKTVQRNMPNVDDMDEDEQPEVTIPDTPAPAVRSRRRSRRTAAKGPEILTSSELKELQTLSGGL